MTGLVMILPEFCVDKADGKARPYALIELSPKTTADKLNSMLMEIAGVEVHTLEGQNMLEVVGKSMEEADSFFKDVLALVDKYNKKQSGNGAELLETRFIYSGAGPKSAVKELQLTAGIVLSFAGVETAADQDTRCRIFLAPGYAFGTGHHPSTRLAASALEEIFNAAGRCPQKVLDVGCGSGILSLLCAKSGAAEVLGIDINPDAVETARRNVVRNNLAHCVRITDTALRKISEQFDLLVANVTPSVMSILAGYFPSLLKPGGQLVISGFQVRQTDDLASMLQQLGFTVSGTYEEGSWRATTLKRMQ